MAGQYKYVQQEVPLPYSQVPVSVVSNIRQPAIPIFTKGEGDFNKEVNYAISPTGASFMRRRQFVGFGRPRNNMQRLTAHFGKMKALDLYKKYGNKAFSFLPPRGTGLYAGGGLGDLVTPEAAQTFSTLADLSTLIMLGTVLWFVFPILKNIRPRIASRF